MLPGACVRVSTWEVPALQKTGLATVQRSCSEQLRLIVVLQACGSAGSACRACRCRRVVCLALAKRRVSI